MFTRTIQLIGQDSFSRLQQKRVILFGVGGVGGWCAEALIRSGLLQLTIVDFDKIDLTNINRQVVANSQNVGKSKVEQMKQHLLLINPAAQIVAIEKRFSKDTSADFHFNDYDYVIDAIDSVEDKAELILAATRSNATLVSSMGAARKLDPSKVSTAEFYKVNGCPLARALRKKFKSWNRFPEKKFQCVYSPEISSVSGTMVHVVGTFGFRLASLVLSDHL